VPILSLITFASDNDSRSLGQVLWNLGFEYVLIEGEHWLVHGAPHFSRPTVLLLSTLDDGRNELLTLLSGSAGQGVLGVYSCRESERDEAILSRCSDFLAWPCRQGELRAKLQSVFGDPRGSRAGAADSAITGP